MPLVDADTYITQERVKTLQAQVAALQAALQALTARVEALEQSPRPAGTATGSAA